MGSLEPASQAKQRCAMRLWTKVCLRVFGVDPILGKAANGIQQTEVERLGDEWTIMRFATLICAQVAAETAAQYVACVKSWHLTYVRRVVGPTESSLALTKLLRGLAKLFKDSKPHNAKRPILKHHMEAWEPFLQDNPKTRVFKAAAHLGFGALLRKSEYTAKSASKWTPARGLTRADIVFKPSIENCLWAEIILPPTKCDSLGEDRIPLILAHDPNALINACASIRAMILQDPVHPSQAAFTPMFRWVETGAPLTGQQLVDMIKDHMEMIGEPPALYASHSLRIGGATALSDANCPDVVIQTMGRWKSDCYKRYCREAFGKLLHWSTVLGRHDARAVQPRPRALRRPRVGCCAAFL